MRAYCVLTTVIAIATVICPTLGRPQLDLESRILNSGAQFVQHPQGAQSYYLPPVVHSGHHQQQQHHQPLLQLPQSQQELYSTAPAEQIQLQIPIETDANNEVSEKKIVLHLPPQQYSVQPQAQYPQIPPRKHYKIILVRSPPAPTPAPQPVTPEIEEQTLIYVLVKKPDEPNVQELEKIQQAQQDAIKFNKPEVFFIKYKENEVQQQVHPVASIEKMVQRQVAPKQSESSTNAIRAQGYNYNAARVARQLGDGLDEDTGTVNESKVTAVDTKTDEIMVE